MDAELFARVEDLGFQVLPDKYDGLNGPRKRIVRLETPSSELIVSLLNLFGRNEELSFWDAFHRTISDPGAYDSVIVIENQMVAFMEGNHGWSSDWKKMPLEEMAERIVANWDQDIDEGMHMNCIVLEENKWNRDIFRRRNGNAVLRA